MGSDRKKDVDIESDPDDPKTTSDTDRSKERKGKTKEQNKGTTNVQKSKKDVYEEARKWDQYGSAYTCRYCYKTFSHKRVYCGPFFCNYSHGQPHSHGATLLQISLCFSHGATELQNQIWCQATPVYLATEPWSYGAGF